MTEERRRHVLSDDDVERIAISLAPKLVQCVRQGHHDFWIDPEKHYLDHVEVSRLSTALDVDTVAGLKELGRLHMSAKSNAFKIILMLLLLISAIGAVIYGIVTHKPMS